MLEAVEKKTIWIYESFIMNNKWLLLKEADKIG